jgi:hypothetical protein
VDIAEFIDELKRIMTEPAKLSNPPSPIITSEKTVEAEIQANADSPENGETFDRKREKQLLRKLDFHLLPVLTLLYLLSFLDRSNGSLFYPLTLSALLTKIVGNARLEGLTTDLHISISQLFTERN